MINSGLLDETAVAALRQRVRGQVICPDDDAYEGADRCGTA